MTISLLLASIAGFAAALTASWLERRWEQARSRCLAVLARQLLQDRICELETSAHRGHQGLESEIARCRRQLADITELVTGEGQRWGWWRRWRTKMSLQLRWRIWRRPTPRVAPEDAADPYAHPPLSQKGRKLGEKLE